MSKVETLDEKLRERARLKLKDDLREKSKPLRSMLQIGHSLTVKVGEEETTCTKLLDTVISGIYEYWAGRYEKDEINEFLEKVESLQEQVEELQCGL